MAGKDKKTKAEAKATGMPVPVFVIGADSAFGMQAMLWISAAVRDGNMPDAPEGFSTKVREFEMYEESTRS